MTGPLVRIAGSENYATFTQRGSLPTAGFIRMNGKTISGYAYFGLFYPKAGKNADVAYMPRQKATA